MNSFRLISRRAVPSLMLGWERRWTRSRLMIPQHEAIALWALGVGVTCGVGVGLERMDSR